MKSYIWRMKASTQNLACSQRQMHTVHTCRLSEARTTKDTPPNKVLAITPPPPPHPLFLLFLLLYMYMAHQNSHAKPCVVTAPDTHSQCIQVGSHRLKLSHTGTSKVLNNPPTSHFPHTVPYSNSSTNNSQLLPITSHAKSPKQKLKAGSEFDTQRN